MSEYLPRLRNGVAQGADNLQELVTQLKQRYERFYNEPAHHRSKAAIDFVKDYWDLGAAVAAGIVFVDADKQILGYNSDVMGGAMGIASALGSIAKPYWVIPERVFRNFLGFSGAGSTEISILELKSGNILRGLTLGGLAASMGMLATAIDYIRVDYIRRDLKQEKPKQQKNQTLEILAQQNNINHSDTAST